MKDMYYAKTKKPAYRRKLMTRAGILEKVSSIKGKSFYEPGGDFLVLTEDMKPAMRAYGKIYADGPEAYKGGRYVYGYVNGSQKLLLCEDARYEKGSGHQDLSMGSDADVESFVKSLRGNLFIMSVRDYEKYMNEKGAVFWVYGNMPLKAGAPVTITRLVMQGRHYPEFDEENGTIQYRFGCKEPKITLSNQVYSEGIAQEIGRYAVNGLVKEVVPGPGSVIRPCG